MAELTVGLIADAVAGDVQAVRQLIREITPVIHARVGRALLRRRGGAGGRDPRQEVEDLTQEVLLLLFADRGRALRQWDPARGLSLLNYVGLLAEREVCNVLRSGRRSPWTEVPTPDEHLDRSAESAREPERIVAARELLGAVIHDVCARLSDQGMQMFQWLIVDERRVDEICTITGMQPAAVHVWKSRIVHLLREAARRLVVELPPERDLP